MTNEPAPEHIQRPHVRPIQLLPVQKDGQTFVALRDPAMLVEQTMVVQPQVVQALQFFRGEKSIEEIANQLNTSPQNVRALAEGLDKVGLLWGPTHERLEQELKQRISDRGAFPVGASGSMGQTAEQCRTAMQQWLDETEDPEVEGEILGIIAPHLDYQRGWPNYAAAYRAAQGVARPDRVLILGTNHFGLGDGVVLTEFGFESPFGLHPADETLGRRLVETLGKPAIIDQLDHLREHSIQLHLPWIHHLWGAVPVVAALIPDPLQPMLEDDGERTGFDQFVETTRQVMDETGGTTFIVASSDLSHVGPQFGEPRAVDDQRRHDIELHDREMMGKFLSGDPEEFLGAMKWNNNPTRWCSIGNMTAALALAQPGSVELIDYRQAFDDQGNVLVSSAAMALMR